MQDDGAFRESSLNEGIANELASDALKLVPTKTIASVLLVYNVYRYYLL